MFEYFLAIRYFEKYDMYLNDLETGPLSIGSLLISLLFFHRLPYNTLHK